MTVTVKSDIVVIGASAGGLEPLLTIARGLPRDFPGALFVVMHLSAQRPSYLAHLLERASALRVKVAADGAQLCAGTITVAVPDRHLVLEPGAVRVVYGPRENRHRPGIDPLFRSAAHHFGPRVVGVVLSGALDDGTAGLFSIRQRAGLAIVQDPHEAVFPDMPRSALLTAGADHTVAAGEIASLLVRHAAEERAVPDLPEAPHLLQLETRVASGETLPMSEIGKPSSLSCPDCGGVLWEMEEGHLLRFRCRVGHGFSTETLTAAVDGKGEEALWAAMRALEEQASFSRRIAERMARKDNTTLAERMRSKAEKAHAHANVIRELLAQTQGEVEA